MKQQEHSQSNTAVYVTVCLLSEEEEPTCIDISEDYLQFALLTWE